MQHLIGGEWVGKSSETLSVGDPASGEVVEEAVLGNAEDVQTAVEAAT